MALAFARRARRRRIARREPEPAPAPFVVGVGRSGTTLLRLMLDAHPQMAVPPETHFLPDVIRACDRGAGIDELAALLDASRRWGDMGISFDELRAGLRDQARLDATTAARTIYEIYAHQHGKARWGDKTPKYSLAMDRIQDALPEARFIHLIRDARDVALSRIRMVEKRGERPPRAGGVARRWRERILQARGQRDGLTGYMEVRYEDLVADTETTLRRICEMCELEFGPAMLAYHENASRRLEEMNRELPDAEGKRKGVVSGAHRLSVHALASEPPKRERLEVWRAEMSADDRAACEEEAGDLLAELGYPLDGVAGPEAAS